MNENPLTEAIEKDNIDSENMTCPISFNWRKGAVLIAVGSAIAFAAWWTSELAILLFGAILILLWAESVSKAFCISKEGILRKKWFGLSKSSIPAERIVRMELIHHKNGNELLIAYNEISKSEPSMESKLLRVKYKWDEQDTVKALVRSGFCVYFSMELFNYFLLKEDYGDDFVLNRNESHYFFIVNEKKGLGPSNS